MSFWYLATAYSKHPEGPLAAFEMACHAAGHLTEAGVTVFSPIVQFHTLYPYTTLDPLDWRAWQRHNEGFMGVARGAVIYMDGGWEQSAGVQAEIAWFKHHHRRVVFMQPYVEDEDFQLSETNHLNVTIADLIL